MIGLTIGGRYRIERILGEGGMGCVYEAVHTGTARRVALKVIQPDKLRDELLKRFGVEAKAAGLIDSEHIAQVLDMGVDTERGTPFMALELLVGDDLRELAKRLGVLPPELALRVVGQALRGVRKAHERGVVHRDLKPANLFLAEREGRRVVKVLDFGIARIRGDHELVVSGEQNITVTGALLGTPRYMSPEQTKGLKRTDERTDVWALGVVLYELLSGQTPHPDAEGVGDLIVRVCTERSRLRDVAPWVPAATAHVVDKALAIEVAARWQSCGEMLAAIEELLPDGLEIRESMLVPLEDHARATTEETTLTSSTAGPSVAASTPSPLAPSTGQTASRGSRGRSFLAGSALGTVAVGITLYVALGASGGAEPTAMATPATAAPSAASPTTASPATSLARAAPPSPDTSAVATSSSDGAAQASMRLAPSARRAPTTPAPTTPAPTTATPTTATPTTATPREKERDPRREL